LVAEESARQLVLNPYLRVIRCGDNEILVKHGTHSLYSHSIVDKQRTRLLGRLVTYFSTPASVDHLVLDGIVEKGLEDASRELTDYLLDRGVLVDPAQSLTGVYVDTILRRGDRRADASGLATKRVALVGEGRLAERVESHLSDLGLLGVARTAGGWDATCESADLVVVASDSFSPSLFHAINEPAIDHRTPWLLAYIDGSEAIIGPTFVPPETSCYYEFEIQAEAALGLRDTYLLYKEHVSSGESGSPPVPPAYVDITAGFSVVAATRHLAGMPGFTVNRAVRIQLETLTVDYVDVSKLPRCPACAPLRPGPRHLYL
jgi:bacteriocin biosynthesis cyclodehydratase domain-containing protein